MILKHKDRELIHFDWIRPFGVKNVEVNEREVKFLPLEFRDLAERGVSRDFVWAFENWLIHRTAPMNRRFVREVMIYSSSLEGGPVNVGFTGPGELLRLIKSNPGLRKNALSRLSGLTERTVKRYLSRLTGKVEFRGAPKTGGYYVKEL